MTFYNEISNILTRIKWGYDTSQFEVMYPPIKNQPYFFGNSKRHNDKDNASWSGYKFSYNVDGIYRIPKALKTRRLYIKDKAHWFPRRNKGGDWRKPKNIRQFGKFQTPNQHVSAKIVQFLKILVREGYIENYSLHRPQMQQGSFWEARPNCYTIALKYAFRNSVKTRSVTRKRCGLLSKTGKIKVYTKRQIQKIVFEDQGEKVYIISTDKGIMTHTEAYQRGLGGIGLCWIK